MRQNLGRSYILIIIFLSIFIFIVSIFSLVYFSNIKFSPTSSLKSLDRVVYYPVSYSGYIYRNCNYIGENDFWNVDKKTGVSYRWGIFNFRKYDSCLNSQIIKEYNCKIVNGISYRAYRLAYCPDNSCSII